MRLARHDRVSASHLFNKAPAGPSSFGTPGMWVYPLNRADTPRCGSIRQCIAYSSPACGTKQRVLAHMCHQRSPVCRHQHRRWGVYSARLAGY
jgi:hypothetical protein